MNSSKIDLLNIFLMVLCCFAAFALPLQVFLLAYSILGPLHYLTEIVWLHERHYYASGKRDFLLFIPAGLAFTGLALFDKSGIWYRYIPTAVFASLAGALGMVLLKDNRQKLLLVIIAFALGYLLGNQLRFQILFAFFIPTLIHVFLFTFLFVVYGALKNRSLTGYASAVVMLLCSASFLLYQPAQAFHVSPYIAEGISETRLNNVILYIFYLLHIDTSPFTTYFDQVYLSSAGHSLLRFAAFAYSYHYMNWFSKTSVIRWHQVPRGALIAVIVLWLGAMLLYALNLRLGVDALLLLSTFHVFMEFPLNFRSVFGIASELGLHIPLAPVVSARTPTSLSTEAIKPPN